MRINDWNTTDADAFSRLLDHSPDTIQSASDTYGTEATSSGALSSTGAAAHPWANFSR
jgi:hypothetical protein